MPERIPMEIFSAPFKEACIKYLRDYYRYPVEDILFYEEDVQGSGGCETCYFEYAVVKFTCLLEDGSRDVVVVSDSFSGFIRDLTEDEDE